MTRTLFAEVKQTLNVAQRWTVPERRMKEGAIQPCSVAVLAAMKRDCAYKGEAMSLMR